MHHDTEPGVTTVGPWVQVVAQSWAKLAKGGETPSTSQLAEELASRLALDRGIALGLIEGVETLVRYAQAQWEETETVIDEERQSIRVALQSVRPILEARLQRRLDEIDQQHPPGRCRGCGREGQSQGRRMRSWGSLVGPLVLTRRYQWCERCQQGRAVAQEKVGLSETDYTPGLEEVCTLMASTVPHQMAVGLVQQMLGIDLSAKAIKSMIQRRGQQVVQRTDQEAKAMRQDYETWGVRPALGASPGVETSIPVAYLEMDGVVVPTRREVETDEAAAGGRGGKGRRYQVKGREVKNAIFYTGTSCAQESDSRGCLLEKSYVSHLGEWTWFAVLVWAQMLKLGFDRATLLVVLSDGAEWIRDVCQWLALPVLLILDLYHVKHRIWEVASAVFGEGTTEAQHWAQDQCQRIEDGHAVEVIASLPLLRRSHRKARDQIESLEIYLTNNLDRMDYPRYRAAGLRVGSGAIESTNYHVTGARLKLPGMRWSETAAAEMARLRTDLFNGCWRQRSRQLLKAA
jgi:hypothetical protein